MGFCLLFLYWTSTKVCFWFSVCYYQTRIPFQYIPLNVHLCAILSYTWSPLHHLVVPFRYSTPIFFVTFCLLVYYGFNRMLQIQLVQPFFTSIMGSESYILYHLIFFSFIFVLKFHFDISSLICDLMISVYICLS